MVVKKKTNEVWQKTYGHSCCCCVGGWCASACDAFALNHDVIDTTQPTRRHAPTTGASSYCQSYTANTKQTQTTNKQQTLLLPGCLAVCVGGSSVLPSSCSVWRDRPSWRYSTIRLVLFLVLSVGGACRQFRPLVLESFRSDCQPGTATGRVCAPFGRAFACRVMARKSLKGL